jgi:hypothetical protein
MKPGAECALTPRPPCGPGPFRQMPHHRPQNKSCRSTSDAAGIGASTDLSALRREILNLSSDRSGAPARVGWPEEQMGQCVVPQ